MSTISLRLPDSLHAQVRELAKKENVSINQLIATDRLDEAVALLQDLNRRVGGQDRDWIDVKIEEIQRAIAQNRFAASYNRAVNQFNGGAYAAAIETLEDLLETDLDALQTDLPDQP